MTIYQRDQSFYQTENVTQCNTINKLEEINICLGSEVVQLRSKQIHELPYLGKRPEVKSCAVFEFQESNPVKRKFDSDLFSERIDRMVKNSKRSLGGFDLKR